MYCPNCGAESTLGLNYCKHCGGNLSETLPPAQPAARNILAALILAGATVAIVLGGLAIVFASALSLIGPQAEGLTPPAHDAVAVAGMMVLFGSSAIVLSTLMLIKLFSRVMGFDSFFNRVGRAKAFKPKRFMTQIPAPPRAVSVTEHTTRNFEPRVYQQGHNE